MKLILTIFFFLFCFSGLCQTNYYVRTDGNNGNNGLTNTAGGAWRTVAFAATTVPINSIINVGIGQTSAIFNEGTSQIIVKTGVTIQGVDTTNTRIRSTYRDSSYTGGVIYLASPEGTQASGSQSISNIWLDGTNQAAYSGIQVWGRSGVKIHHVKITDFTGAAVVFNGNRGAYAQPPGIYAHGNELYNSRLSNCGERGKVLPGLIVLAGQSTVLIHDNLLFNVSRAQGKNGNIIYAIEGNNEGIKYYNNLSYKPMNEGNEWNMHIESWNTTGGNEVYGNTFNGGGDGIDAAEEQGGVFVADNFSYGWKIYNNLFQMPTQMPAPAGRVTCGIVFEGHATNSEVYNNHFLNTPSGVQFSTNLTSIGQSNMRVYNNLFENMGYGNNAFGGFMVYMSGGGLRGGFL